MVILNQTQKANIVTYLLQLLANCLSFQWKVCVDLWVHYVELDGY